MPDGHRYRLFNVIDDFNREGLGIEIDFSWPTMRVIRSLNQIIEWHGKPKVICCDNGSMYIRGQWLAWAEKKDIKIEHTQSGKPQQNAYVERYSRTVRYNGLRHYLAESIQAVQDFATRWMGRTATNTLTWHWWHYLTTNIGKGCLISTFGDY